METLDDVKRETGTHHLREADLNRMREELRGYWENEFTEKYQQLNGGTDPETEKYFSKLDDTSMALQQQFQQQH